MKSLREYQNEITRFVDNSELITPSAKLAYLIGVYSRDLSYLEETMEALKDLRTLHNEQTIKTGIELAIDRLHLILATSK